jgi:hypothetical protein
MDLCVQFHDQRFLIPRLFLGQGPPTHATVLHAWQHCYNQKRFSMVLNGQTPADPQAAFLCAVSERKA